MRLVFLSHRYWPSTGGVETFLRHISRGLASRHEVTVLTQRLDDQPAQRLTDGLRPSSTFEPFQDGGARVTPLRVSSLRRALVAPLEAPGIRRYTYGAGRRSSAKLLARAMTPAIAQAARKADLLHLWGGDVMAEAAVRAARAAGASVVITPFAHRGQWGDDSASAIAYRAADRVFALLGADARLYRELGIPERQVAQTGVCSPGVEPGGGPELRRRHGIAGPLVLFLGVRRPYKGWELLLSAASLVAATRQDVTFAFVGPGEPLSPDHDGPRVIDAGAVSDQERAAWLDAADLMCLPSDAEIFPVSVLEAWSVRTPVLLSDIEPLVELIEVSHGGRATRREPSALAETMIGMLGDVSALNEFGAAGHRFWAARHTVDAVVERHERLYEEAIAERRQRCAA